jgi:hypothetical protein
MSTVDNMSTFSSAHAVGGLDESLGLRQMKDVAFPAYFFFLEIWTETCLLNASFILASFVFLTKRTKNLCY